VEQSLVPIGYPGPVITAQLVPIQHIGEADHERHIVRVGQESREGQGRGHATIIVEDKARQFTYGAPFDYFP
jgi:hypothetical protein